MGQGRDLRKAAIWGGDSTESTALTVGQLSGDMKETPSVRKRLGRVQRQGLTTEPPNLCIHVTQRSLLFLKSSGRKEKAVSSGKVSRGQVGRCTGGRHEPFKEPPERWRRGG